MSYVVINAISVPAAQADELAARFAGRAGMVESADGFERFELLRPADRREQWLVMTTWRDEAAFQGWMASSAFGQAHGNDGGGGGSGGGGPGGGGPGGGGPAGGESGGGESAGGHPAGPPGSGAHGHGGGRAPIATTSEVWAFTVEQHTSASS
jgi:heme-degrading monooxygenase HmoA